MDIFLKGMTLGFYVGAPIGVISVLYITRALQNGAWSGIVSALAVTTVESFYASVAIYGLSFVSDFLLEWQLPLQISGAFFLICVGIKSLLVNPDKKSHLSKSQSLVADFLSMIFLTLLNPITIVAFVAIFGSMGAGSFDLTFPQSLEMLAGFAFMSISYCLALITIALFIKTKFNTSNRELMKILYRLSGVVIIIFTIGVLTFSLTGN